MKEIKRSDGEIKASSAYGNSIGALYDITNNLYWPDLGDFYPEDSSEAYALTDECGELSTLELSGNDVFWPIEEMITTKDLKVRPSDYDEVMYQLHCEYSELTHDLFDSIAVETVTTGLLSKLGKKERIIIQKLIKKALYFGRDFAETLHVGANGEKIYSPTQSEISRNNANKKNAPSRKTKEQVIELSELKKEKETYKSNRALAKALLPEARNIAKKNGMHATCDDDNFLTTIQKWLSANDKETK